MQLGKKSKTTDIFEKVRNELGASAEEATPLISAAPHSVASPDTPMAIGSARPISIVINETIAAELSREGVIKSYEVKGDLQLCISDSSLNKIKLAVTADESSGAQFKTHPNVDKNLFTTSKVIQAKDPNRPFPANGNALGVLRWRQASKPGIPDDNAILPITFVVWVSASSSGHYSVTVEYELQNLDQKLQDVIISIPYQTSEPVVNSTDEVYEVTGDSIDWNMKFVRSENSSGSFEFEAQADSEAEFFPMQVSFRKETPFVNVDVSYTQILLFYITIANRRNHKVINVSLTELSEDVHFHKDIRCGASGYTIT